MSPKPWYANGLRFSCTRSGNCCKSHGKYEYVYLADQDVEAIADYLGLAQSTFHRRYCARDGGYTILKITEPECPFLDEAGGCSIYSVRPKQCATWPFWEENLKEEVWKGPVRKVCPGIDQGECHSMKKVERIARETEIWYEGEEE